MKKAYLDKLAQALQAHAPRDTILVCATRGEGRRILSAVAGTGAVLVGVRAETPFTLARQLCAEQLRKPQAPRFIEEVEGAELVRSCMDENLGVFSGVNAKSLSATMAIYRTFQEIALAGHPADLSEHEAVKKNPKLQALQTLRTNYMAQKEGDGNRERLLDRADLMAMALQEAQGKHPLQKSYFVVLGDYAPSAMERQLLEQLSAPDRLTVVELDCGKDLTAVSTADEGQYLPMGAFASKLPRQDVLSLLKSGAGRFVACRGTETEVRFPLRDILEKKCSLEECAIVYLSGSYAQPLYEEAHRFAMPVTLGGGLPLMGSMLYTTLKKVYQLPENDFYAEDICTLLESGCCTPDWAISLAERFRKKSVGWSAERMLLACEYEEAELGKPTKYSTEDWKKLLAYWEGFLKLLLAVAQPGQTLLEQQKKDLTAFLAFCNHNSEAEAVACAKARELANSVTALEKGETLLRRLLSLMENASYLNGKAEAGKLYLAPLSQAACMNRKYLYIVGFSRYALQGVRQESPILLDGERLELGKLKTTIQQGREQEFRLLTLLARHEGEYILSYPDFSSEEMLEQEPAPFFRDAAGNRVEYVTYLPKVACLPADRLLLAQGGVDIQPPQPHAAGDKDEIQLQAVRSVKDRLLDMEISATALETALKCPYAFWLQRMLHIRAPQKVERNDEKWLQPRHIGTFCHKVLEEYYKQPGCPDWKPIFDREYAKLKHDVPLPQPHLEQEEKANLRAIVERAIQWTRDEHRTVLATEEDFHQLPLTFGKWTIKMEGSIDRVDRLPDGSIAILDYKTGNSEKYIKSIHRYWQHYLYTMAEEALHPNTRKVDRAGYLFLKEEAEQLDLKENADLREETEARVEWLLDRISQPGYDWECIPGFTPKTTDDNDPNLPPPKPVMLEAGGSTAEVEKCTNCEFWAICPENGGKGR